VRRFFTLYFIPCIPLDVLGEYVECQDCTSTYKPDVLDYDPAASQAKIEAEMHIGMRRVMVGMMMADGVADPAEIATIRQIYAELSGEEISTAAVEEEIRSTTGQTALSVAASLVGVLNASGKELVIRAAFQVANADGRFQDEERALLDAIGVALDMTPAHVKGVLAELQEAS